MHTESGLPNDDHCCDTKLNFSAAKLEVFRHERLANTEPPRKISPPRKNSSRREALLKVMAAWARAHF